jgi:hypothetical protein
MRRLSKLAFFGLLFVCATKTALSGEIKADAINSAELSKDALSNQKLTPAGIRLQVLLSRW